MNAMDLFKRNLICSLSFLCVHEVGIYLCCAYILMGKHLETV